MKKLIILTFVISFYLFLHNMAFAACTYMSTFTGTEVIEYVLYNGQDTTDAAGVSLNGGQTFKNNTLTRMDPLCRVLNVTGNITIYNCVIDGDCYVAAGITLTTYNCAFSESKANAQGDGTITDTNCQFSISDFGFQNKSGGDFRLVSESVLRNKGYDTGSDTDLIGTITPMEGVHDIGAYEYVGGQILLQ